MNFALTEEQIQLRDVLRRYLANRAPIDVCRSSLDAGPDAVLWRALAQEMGIAGALVPETLGGQGFGGVELSLLMNELGRVLYPGPVLSVAVLAARILSAFLDDQTLPSIVDGDPIVLAGAEDSAGWNGPAMSASYDAGAACVTGVKTLVDWAGVASKFLVVAQGSSGTSGSGLVLLSVDADAPGVRIAEQRGLDPACPRSVVTFDRAPAALLLDGIDDAFAEALDVARVALASELVGSMDRMLELIVGHCSARVQFGVPLSGFQVIRHRCADLLTELELARSATLAAACEIDAGDRDATAQAAAIALAATGDAALLFSREMVQLHGGIGFTWEHDAHLFVRRLQTGRQLLGAPAVEYLRLWDLVAVDNP